MNEENNQETVVKTTRQERKLNLRKRFLPKPDKKEVEDLDRAVRRRKVRQIALILGAAAIAAIIILVVRTVRQLRPYTDYSVVWENEELASSTANYAQMGSLIIRVTMDGVTCLNESGETAWNYGYTMRNPRIETRESYGVIYDVQSQNAIIFNTEGVLGTINTNRDILNASISDYGVVALVLDDTSANYITFYDSIGNALDIQIKTILSGDGYPIDIGLSPSGTGLVSSVIFLDQSKMQNQVTFYNFDVGKTESNRVVGYFNCGDIMYPQVRYLTDTVVCAFGDAKIDLYSLKNESKPELIHTIEFDHNLYSVVSDDKQIGVVTQSDEHNRILRVYDLEGSLKYEQPVEFEYSDIRISNGYVLLYNSTECMILSDAGRIRYQGTLESNIRGLIMLNDREMIVMGSASTKKIRF